MNIYVGNLPYSVRDEELRATFEAYGQVVAAEVIFDKHNGTPLVLSTWDFRALFAFIRHFTNVVGL